MNINNEDEDLILVLTWMKEALHDFDKSFKKDNVENKININDEVEFITPFEDEKGLTFFVREIEPKDNWCLLEVNVNMTIRPTIVVDIDKLRKITI